MPLTVPPGIDAEGAVKVAFVPTLANPAAPTLAAVNAVGALDISCYLTKDGFGVGADTTKGKDERLCTKEVYETLGATTWSIDKLVYVWNPQGGTTDVTNKAYALMKQGTQGFLVVRWGKDATSDFAANDVVDVFPVSLDAQVPQKPEANSKLKVEQAAVVSGKPQRDVKLT